VFKPIQVELPRHRSCGATARRVVEEYAREDVKPEDLDDLKLIATELVSNAYLHGKGRIWMKLNRREQRIRIEVIDQGEGAAVELRPARTAQNGHGLKIVDRLASAWGAHEGTTHVWAELPLRPAVLAATAESF
jgi:anti-sigma regulatory factor (Ser/Thr protein kinase)